ncbi:protein of unknown function [Chitinophaga jiangningensis]|uniref:DUF4270 domain-containing protein n=1 Tax=Chitinophaga jiangningensis TaxID=1419482 RepID=A0A1M7G3J9_9BACT|nr:DUF4270 family protein [Chitinophaga jiangningensis]SHM10715.1 protein of unknown function [Chitinophaga jiangningensis]
MNNKFMIRLRTGIWVSLTLLLLSAVLPSCQKTGFTYDNIIDNNETTDYIITDTLSVEMKNIQYDSVPTSGSGAALIGRNNDPLFGKITAGTYFQIAAPASLNIPEFGASYDSMSLIMTPNAYYEGDTTAQQDLRVYRVQQTIKPATNFNYIYNNNTFQTETTPIGSFTGLIRPHTDKTISVPMSNTLGAQLFEMIRSKSPDISTANTWQEFFKGLNIEAGPLSKGVTGFQAQDSSLYMRLYYHINEMITTVKYVDFKLTNNTVQFNHVSYDRSETAISALGPAHKTLPTGSTNNTAYMQPITGVITRLDIPYVKNLLQLGKYFQLMKVILTLKPIAGSYTDHRLPPRLALCRIDNSNNITDTLTYGTLVKDDMFNENTYYAYDITSYCKSELTADGLTTRGLALTPSSTDAKTTLDRLVLGDQKNTGSKLKIQVYYLLYK